jgi:hypothetical protein
MEKKTCDKDCFNCKYDDCIIDGVFSEEREDISYRDKCALVTGILPLAHGSKKNRGRKGGRYTSDILLYSRKKW